MILEPVWLTVVKRTLALLLVISVWLWMSADEYEEELEHSAQTVQTVTPRVSEPEPILEEDEPELIVAEPEPQHGWIVPPEPVRKAAGKIKRKIKKTVKK